MTYGCIVADPPWKDRGHGLICRGSHRHYDVVPDREIAPLIASSPLWDPAESAHFWLWVTNNRLEVGLKIMRELGFRYVTNMAWVKVRKGTVQIGLGQYLRGSHELCLLGVRGSTMIPSRRDVPSAFMAPRGRHSAKPEVAFKYIERVSSKAERRAELFARAPRDGWDVWGNDESLTDPRLF